MSTSADALLALNALLSASANAVQANDGHGQSTSAGPTDSLTNLLDTLANFSAGVNTFPGGDGGGGGSHESQPSSNLDIASLLLAGLANAKNESDPATVEDYDRYERDREQKFRDLEAKFSFLSSKKPKIEPKGSLLPPTDIGSATRMHSDTETLAAAGKAFATSAMAELLSGFQKSRVDKNVASSSTLKSVPHKRRSRSASSSESESESSRESSSDSSRSERARKRKAADRKKKAKKLKTKKDKQKNGGKESSTNKQAKVKKDLFDAERKAVAEHISKLKSSLVDYDKRHRTLEEELARLKKQHNEMCRKLQRQKSDPRKDTLIIENEALQADIEKHLKAGEKQKENDEKQLAAEEKHFEKLKKQAKMAKKDDTNVKKDSATVLDGPSAAKKAKEENIEYFDPGSHWCKNCNVSLTNVFEWLEHLHSQKHKSNVDALDRPWMPEHVKAPIKKEVVAALKPIRGAEFLMPSMAFYCNLCKEFSGDSLSAEAHLKSTTHNSKYEAYVSTNPFYERRAMLEKAAAVSHRLEKSVSSTGTDDKKSHHRSSDDRDRDGKPRAPEPQRVPHKPNESGKIKPFQLASSSTDKDKKSSSSSNVGFSMKLSDPKKSSSSSSSSLRKPHLAFSESSERPKHGSSSRDSDRKRYH